MSFVNTTSIGNKGEDIACDFLRKNKFKICERNFQNAQGRKIGEIDIVATKGKQLHFIEVKTRLASDDDILPESNITPIKLHNLQRIAQIYITANNLWEAEQHFDAVSITLNMDTRKAKIKYLPDIFY